jgi:glutamine amidotransferase
VSAGPCIVGSGGANIASLRFALERLGASATLTTDARQLSEASHVILPGVGAAADAMARLRALGLADAIRGLRQPVLGICLGMQLLGEASDEDDVACLGLIPERARRLPAEPGLAVPHMGWNAIDIRRECPLLAGIPDGAYFYFIHSYALPCDDTTVAGASHGAAFSAIAQKDNFYATQFHPERSAAHGAQLLANFLALT